MKWSIIGAIIFLVFYVLSSDAHVLSVRSEYSFDQAVTQAPFAIVYLYHSKPCVDNCGDHRREYKKMIGDYNSIIRHNRKILKIVSNRYRYKMADVQAIVVDLSKANSPYFMRTCMNGQDEAFLFFSNGRLEESVPCFSGSMERITLENIVENLWQKKIDEIIQKKEEIRRKQADDRRMAHAWWWSSGGYPFPYGGYSYWGYPGCGWGGYGYPYGGCCNRGYVNVGFGFGC